MNEELGINDVSCPSLLLWDVVCPHCKGEQPRFDTYINLPLGISGCVCRKCLKPFRIKGEIVYGVPFLPKKFTSLS